MPNCSEGCSVSDQLGLAVQTLRVLHQLCNSTPCLPVSGDASLRQLHGGSRRPDTVPTDPGEYNLKVLI